MLNGGVLPQGDVRALKGTVAEKFEAIKSFYAKQLGDPSMQSLLKNQSLILRYTFCADSNMKLLTITSQYVHTPVLVVTIVPVFHIIQPIP